MGLHGAAGTADGPGADAARIQQAKDCLNQALADLLVAAITASLRPKA